MEKEIWGFKVEVLESKSTKKDAFRSFNLFDFFWYGYKSRYFLIIYHLTFIKENEL